MAKCITLKVICSLKFDANGVVVASSVKFVEKIKCFRPRITVCSGCCNRDGALRYLSRAK